MKIGLIINPLAGIGGSVALKGSDGEDIVSQALAKGAQPQAQQRARESLQIAMDASQASEISFYTAGNSMGQAVLQALELDFNLVYTPANEPTSAEDTRKAITEFTVLNLDLILFVGGDGTARDVFTSLAAAGKDEQLPVIGIPAGCKIHSAVYAVSPHHAGELLSALIAGKPLGLRMAEVMDLDEELFRQGRVKASCYGYLLVPEDSTNMQMIKQGGIDHESAAQLDIAAAVVANMEDDVLYLVGSGSTTAAVMQELQLENTLLGVDAVLNGERIASDLDEAGILALCESHPTKIIVTLIGGQGHLFGRGNQQFSARVLRKIGRDNIIVIASNGKLRSLDGRPIRMDTGDSALDAEWAGAVQVVTGYEQKTLYKIA